MKNNNQKLIDSLVHYGLSEKEAKVYVVILEMGKAPVSVIARRSWVKRVTVYMVLDDLQKKWICSETIYNEMKYFSVISPETIYKNYQQQFEQFRWLLPDFLSLQWKYGNKPAMQFVEGKENLNQLLRDYCDLRCNNTIKHDDRTRRWYQDYQFVDNYFDRLQRYRKKKPANMKINLFSNRLSREQEISNKLQATHNRTIKEIPEWFLFTSTIRVMGDYILMINMQDKGDYAVHIHDKEFARNLKQIFMLLWKTVQKKLH